jgi:hypothetical protein
VRGEPGLAGGDPGPAGAQELTDLAAAVHRFTVRRCLAGQLAVGGTARPPEERCPLRRPTGRSRVVAWRAGPVHGTDHPSLRRRIGT